MGLTRRRTKVLDGTLAYSMSNICYSSPAQWEAVGRDWDKFALKPSAVSTVIPGMRNERQAELNCAVGKQPPMSDELEKKLRSHAWLRAFWYSGKN